MIDVYYYKTEKGTELFSETEKRLFRILSPVKADLISSSASEKVKQMSFYGEAVTLGLLRSGYSVAGLPLIEYTEKGKPFISYGSPFFNISHTDGCIFIAISDREIGIDAEVKRAFDSKVADRYFSQAENTYVSAAVDKDVAYTRIWTRKEAYVKYTGEGIDLSRFREVDAFDERIATFSVENKYTLSVCSDGESTNTRINEISTSRYKEILMSLEAACRD